MTYRHWKETATMKPKGKCLFLKKEIISLHLQQAFLPTVSLVNKITDRKVFWVFLSAIKAKNIKKMIKK